MLVLCISFSLVILDQITKYLVKNRIDLHEHIELIPGFFSLTYIQNTGAAWGMFAGFGGWLIALSIIMLVALIFFRRHFIGDALLHRITISLMIAGITGNLIDRIFYGYVIDFLNFYWKVHHHAFPAFNVADSCICVGVGLYILSQYLHIDGTRTPVQMIGPTDLGGKG